jgi:predicted site-specific integrase-resolvase
MLLTARQAADRLGVTVERVLHWTGEGRLPIAGQDEDGRELFREHVIATKGQALVALAPPAVQKPQSGHD